MIDKRALKRRYLETKTRAGVYAIKNQVNGRVLISGSTNAQAAINRQRFELKMGKHSIKSLRADWAEFGADAFVFEVLDMVKHRDDPGFNLADELNELVGLWQEEVDCPDELNYRKIGKTP